METSTPTEELDTYALLLKQLDLELNFLKENTGLGSTPYEASLRLLKKTVKNLINISLDEINGDNSRKKRYKKKMKKQIKFCEDERQRFKYNNLN